MTNHDRRVIGTGSRQGLWGHREGFETRSRDLHIQRSTWEPRASYHVDAAVDEVGLDSTKEVRGHE